MVFAAIDIGSNAVRLNVTNVYESGMRTLFKSGSIIRVPIRLGEDAFLTGRISREKEEALLKAMHAFKHLIDIHKPIDYLACATSAMRVAENGSEIMERVEKRTGIPVTIIDGQKEAEIVYSNHIAEDMPTNTSYLYIEVGGGSTELTLFANNTRIFSRSFPVGTVRILNGLVDESQWKEIKRFLKKETEGYQPVVGIGSGGNINFIFKMMRKKEGTPISVKKLDSMRTFLSAYSFEDRILHLGIRPDRADVVVPALDIFLSVMKWAGISKLLVPKIGVADGIIHLLYEKYRFKRVLELFDVTAVNRIGTVTDAIP